MSSRPMTKLWYMTLKPPTTTSNAPFRQLWTEVIDFCTSASGPTSSGHTLWQDQASADTLVMISGYPSYESNQAADKAYVENGYASRMAEFVDHGRLLQLDVDVNTLTPAGLGPDGEVLYIETVSAAREEVGEGCIEGVEIGKGGLREKVWLRFRGVKGGDLKKGEESKVERFHTVQLRWIM